jgi:ferric-dicitrate binding protein FerR (iron transport regulator)
MKNPAMEPLDPAQERAREALDRMPAAPPDPDFRATLRAEVATGRFRERGTGRPLEDALRRRAGPRGVLGSPAVRWAGVPLAFAALLMMVSALNRAPDWSVSAASGLGIAVVDGQPIPMNHTAELARALQAGARVRVPEGSEIELMGPGQMLIQLTSGTDFVVPPTPGRWWRRSVSAEVRAGELRITTGPHFHGARLTLTTPAARVEVTGTTLAVICDPEGTCVCVLEGRVRVGPLDGALADVEGGHLRFIYSDGREPKVAGMREVEATRLGEMRSNRAPLLGATP